VSSRIMGRVSSESSIRAVCIESCMSWTGRFIENADRDLSSESDLDALAEADAASFVRSAAELGRRLGHYFGLGTREFKVEREDMKDENGEMLEVIRGFKARKLRISRLQWRECGQSPLDILVYPCAPVAMAKVWATTALKSNSVGRLRPSQIDEFLLEAGEARRKACNVVCDYYTDFVGGSLVSYMVEIIAFTTSSPAAYRFITAESLNDVARLLDDPPSGEDDDSVSYASLYLRLVNLATGAEFATLKEMWASDDAGLPEFVRINVDGDDHDPCAFGLFAKHTIKRDTANPVIRLVGISFSEDQKCASLPHLSLIQNYNSVL